MENGSSGFAFSSGMAALSAVTRLLEVGEEIIVPDDIYGGLYRLLTNITIKMGIHVNFVDTTKTEEVKRALTKKTKMVIIETPSNPLMKISDIASICSLVHSYGSDILCVVDSSLMTPLLQNPLDLGADVVVHSGTKFFGGHSDATVGLVAVNNELRAKKLAFVQNAEGTGLAPFECWLTLRGIKTMAIRLEKAQENAKQIVEYLSRHPHVTAIYYPGFYKPNRDSENDRSRDFQKELSVFLKQSKGGGCVISFDTGNLLRSKSFINALKLFRITVSFGSVNSLVELPCVLSHSSIPSKSRSLPESLIRMSIGIENIHDLISDINQAFQADRDTSKL
uniref:cysteine-S-conjugate beta-lyase n=2 Tax=Arcella intermedia TaxID=1963864 RepID=A0A6B2L6Q6_9EUKA